MNFLSRNVIKFVAILAMTCNHFALVFLHPDTLLYEILVDIGYFTAVTMCYFLVEGYHYTHDRRKYGQRLLVFGVISQIPYMLVIPYRQLNMLVTLFLCYQIMCVLDSFRSDYDKNCLICLLFAVSLFSDWALLAPLFTVLFAKSRGDRRRTGRAFAMSTIVFAGSKLLSLVSQVPVAEALFRAFCASLGIVAAGLVIVCGYQGQRAKKGHACAKWFFYLYYPAHLFVLWIIKSAI